MKLNSTHLFRYFLVALFALNLLQSQFTELLFDEAYYWHYARELSWGYFDHPPMVALLIKISGVFFGGELGVRFMSCILSVGTVAILWQVIDLPGKKEYIPHFFALVFSMTLLNAYGFFTLPDTPLLFFTALFLWCYNRFLKKEKVSTAIMMGLIMSALMYSKYHAFLVILFVFLSNLKLVFSRYAWLAVAVAIISYIPHLVWLYEHDYISIRYHLFERPNRSYDFNDFTLGYFVNLIAVFGFTFPWIYQALFRTKATNMFGRALVYLVYGVLIFFFISSFQRRVQTQWIIVICIPMVVIVYRYMIQHPVHRKWLIRAAMANCLVLLILRIGLIYEPLFPIIFETHGNKKWVEAVASVAGDTPVVFENSYRRPPMYAFYSGNTSYSLNNVFYRENQYNIDGTEALLQGKEVLYIANRFDKGDMSYTNREGKRFYGRFVEKFESNREIECEVSREGERWQDVQVRLEVYNPYEENISLQDLEFAVVFLNAYKQPKAIAKIKVIPEQESMTALPAGKVSRFHFQMPGTNKLIPSYFRMAISEYGLIWGLNSRNIKLDQWK
jgi:hypothetical protein